MAATRKEEKYVDLGARYIFEPIAVETLGGFNASVTMTLIKRRKRPTSEDDDTVMMP